MLLPEGLRNPRQLVLEIAARALAPEPELTVSQWADANRKLSSKASGEPGDWETARTPYLREIMDAMSVSHPCKDGVHVKGTQLGGSEALYNVLGYSADQVPMPAMLVMPTTDGVKKIARQRIDPMIEETPTLRAKFAQAKSRSSSNTMSMKDYPGGIWVFVGANSGPGLRNMPMRMVLQDEIDAYPDDVDGEGDPCQVADKRTDQFSARCKRFKCSTPKVKGSSRIWKRFEEGTQGRYHVPCPHCEHLQCLRWEQMRWAMVKRRELICGDCGGISAIDGTDHSCEHCGAQPELSDANTRDIETDEVDRAWYECESCGQGIEEHHKTAMLEEWPAGRARYIHAAPGAGTVLDDDDRDPHAIWAWVRGKMVRFLPRYVRPLSWHTPALLSPLGWKSWFDCVTEFIKAEKGGYNEDSGESLKQVFWNTVRGEPYEVIGEQPKVNLVKQRVDDYALGQVPAGGLFLTAFVDVQGDRLEYLVDAFGPGEEAWTVDYQVIHGDPRLSGPGSVWAELEKLREKAYPHAGGSMLRISAMGIDSGYLTQEVYDFCRKWSHQQVLATKGDGSTGKPVIRGPVLVDINHRGKKIKNGARLWHIGTDTVKERFYSRLDLGIDLESGQITERSGPGYQHFPRGLPDAFFDGIVSEKLLRRKVRGVEQHEWVKTFERNEPLDLKVGCYSVAVYAGLQRANWQQLQQLINPQQRDIFATAAAQDNKGTAEVPAATDTAATAEAAPPTNTEVQAPAQVARRVRKSNWVTGFRT